MNKAPADHDLRRYARGRRNLEVSRSRGVPGLVVSGSAHVGVRGPAVQQLSWTDDMMLCAELLWQEAEFDQLVTNPVAHRLNQPRKPLRFNDFSSPCTLVHTPGA
jgi:hypothetical protein